MAACLPETYLSAFQSLHLGQPSAVRYQRNALRGKSVLILGATYNNTGTALIELALAGGAANIYATAKKKNWQKLVDYGVMPLGQDCREWMSRLEGTIDLIVATNAGLREDVLELHFRALRAKGQLVYCGERPVGSDIFSGKSLQRKPGSMVCSKNKSLTKMMGQTHNYNVYEQWEKELDRCKRDLKHLLELLQLGTIKPNILDRLSLDKVAKAHVMLENKKVNGFLVCEPWMRGKKRAVFL